MEPIPNSPLIDLEGMWGRGLPSYAYGFVLVPSPLMVWCHLPLVGGQCPVCHSTLGWVKVGAKEGDDGRQ